ncbi:MAG: aldo/keto reductase [Flavisolibacter sp.]
MHDYTISDDEIKYYSTRACHYSIHKGSGKRFLEWLKNYAAKKGATPSQIAFAWLLAKRKNIVRIPGTATEAHLLENPGAINFQLEKR